jgi:hypothetical protein
MRILCDLSWTSAELHIPQNPLSGHSVLSKHADQLNDCRSESHEDDGWQNEYDQGGDHLNRSFRSLFFRPLTALSAQ